MDSAKQQGMEHPDCEYFSWNCRVQERGEDEGASAMHGGALEEWDRDCVRCRKFRTGAYDNFTSRSFKGCHPFEQELPLDNVYPGHSVE